MAKKKSARKQSRSSWREWIPALPEMSWMPSRSHMGIFAWVAFLGGAIIAWVMGVPRLQAEVAQMSWADTTEVTFESLPEWVEGDLLAKLELTVTEELTGSPLDQTGLVRARTSLLDSGWFDDVAQIRRVDQNRILVTASFVRPFAVIRDENGDHLVDPSGTLLPRSFPRGSTEGRDWLKVIDGAYFDKPHRPGLQWDGADVTASLRLLRLIDTKPWFRQVHRVDASSFLQEDTLIIQTDRGSTILWGSPPGDSRPGEASAERKLYYLDYQFENFQHIDGGHRGHLDITSLQGVFAGTP